MHGCGPPAPHPAAPQQRRKAAAKGRHADKRVAPARPGSRARPRAWRPGGARCAAWPPTRPACRPRRPPSRWSGPRAGRRRRSAAATRRATAAARPATRAAGRSGPARVQAPWCPGMVKHAYLHLGRKVPNGRTRAPPAGPALRARRPLGAPWCSNTGSVCRRWLPGVARQTWRRTRVITRTCRQSMGVALVTLASFVP